MSIADREIIAQGKASDAALDNKRLVGAEKRDELRNLPGTFGKDSPKLRGRSLSMNPIVSKGKEKMPERPRS